MSIPVVDGYDLFRDMLAHTLNEAGYYDVLTEESALETFEKLGMDNPDSGVSLIYLTLMDINMPDLEGVKASNLLKANSWFRDIAVIMITGVLT